MNFPPIQERVLFLRIPIGICIKKPHTAWDMYATFNSFFVVVWKFSRAKFNYEGFWKTITTVEETMAPYQINNSTEIRLRYNMENDANVLVGWRARKKRLCFQSIFDSFWISQNYSELEFVSIDCRDLHVPTFSNEASVSCMCACVWLCLLVLLCTHNPHRNI